MSSTPIRVLLIEDNPGDARLIREMLSESRSARFELEAVDRLAAGLERLAADGIDVVLLDLSLPDTQGLATFVELRAERPKLPVVVLSGLDDQTVAVQAVQHGAQDYLVKGRVSGDLLARALRYAIQRQQAQEHIRELNASLEQRVEERTRELADAHHALQRAYQDLRELDRMKSAFLDVITHELNTPLMALGGMLALGQNYLPRENAQLQRSFTTARRAARRLETLVARILKVASSGDFAAREARSPTAPAELVRDVAADAAPFAQLRGQTLETRVPGGLPPVRMVREQIRDVLLQLVMNAVKFTPDGGRIEVEARRPEPGSVQFRVSDTGVGIAEADKPHVFEHFFTTFDTMHHSTGDYEFQRRGIGVGLAIVKHFVEMQGGQVGFESEPGRGSTFWFTLPL